MLILRAGAGAGLGWALVAGRWSLATRWSLIA